MKGAGAWLRKEDLDREQKQGKQRVGKKIHK